MNKAWLVLWPVIVVAGCKSHEPLADISETGWRALLARIPDRGDYVFDLDRASRFAALSLACMDREYPNKPAQVLDGDQNLRPPRELTPAFFGCFDWHSAVHGHWALVRLLKKSPNFPEAAGIRAKLGAHINRENLKKELEFFQQERNLLFERPYGWGWLLRLAAELEDFEDPDAKNWYQAIQPFAQYLSRQSISYFNRLSVPVRHGTHQCTAFAMVHMLDYARQVKDVKLTQTVEQRAMDFFFRDRDCPTHYEPSGEDFISPCLVEADLMRRVLPAGSFVSWLNDFLPAPTDEKLKPLLVPVEIRDIRDAKIGHLIGLALQRAWTFMGIANTLPEKDPRQAVFIRLARLHRHDALEKMFDSGYGGEHWLASFAIYLLTGVGT